MANTEKLDVRQSDQTRNRLLEAGLNLLSRKGYRGATTREIAMEAGVTEVTMYRHFRSKEELFAAAVARHSQQVLDLVPDPSSDLEADLLKLATAYLEHVSSVPIKLLRVFPELKEHQHLREVISDVMHGFRARILSLIHYYQSSGELVHDADDVIFNAFIGPIYFSSLGLATDNGFDCRHYVRLFLNGYRSISK